MTPQRPAGVSETATLIYPGQTYGPGYGVQQASIARIAAIIGKQNADAMIHYSNALRDWTENAAIYKGLGMPVPPAPIAPHVTKLHIIYGDIAGNPVDSPEGADGLHYAWVEEVAK